MGLENQAEVNYAMPVKDTVYDALQYASQVEKAAQYHEEAARKKKLTGEKASSGAVSDIRVISAADGSNYASVDNLYIGVQEGAALLPGDTYRIEKPVVFYGSSITQGGCASRAGNCYEDMLSRRFDFDYINLGFSGNAKGEDAMADYLASLNMSMFVYDYDHNTPTLEHLQNTHDKLFRKVRAAHPDIPVIFMTAPNFDANWNAYTARRNQIFTNYVRAYEEGDRNVYFVDGERMLGFEGRDACTVDGFHPNDLGMYRMAEAVGSAVRGVFEKKDRLQA